MNNKFKLLAVAILLILSTVPTQAQTPSEVSVKAAIKRMTTNPDDVRKEDLETVIRFGASSPKVMIQFGDGLIELGASEADQQVNRTFFGYYIAGAIQYDLAHPRQAKDALADKSTAIKAMLLAYRSVQKKNPAYKQPFLDRLATLEKQGKLDAHIRSAVGKLPKMVQGT